MLASRWRPLVATMVALSLVAVAVPGEAWSDPAVHCGDDAQDAAVHAAAVHAAAVHAAAVHADADPVLAPQARILNGVPASIRSFPSVVLILLGGEGTCTGTVVSPRWVLTAAHCRPSASPTGVEVYYGGDDLRGFFEGSVRVRRVVNHPAFRFDPRRPEHDIALFELESPINVPSMPLPTETSPKPRGTATIVGWGQIGEGEETQVLRSASVPISDDAPCEAAMVGWFDPLRMVCVSGAPAMPCPGDSGGPMLVASGGVTGQVGVNSVHSPPCGPGSSMRSVYVSVSAYRYWIDAVTAGRPMAPIDGTVVRFWDVPSHHAHHAGVGRVAQAGITGGYADLSFRPQQPVTRGQMATFLSRTLSLPDPGGAGFFDVPPHHVHAPGIRAVAAAGIAGGFADGSYRLDAAVTRGQMATFLMRAARLPPGPVPTRFADVASTNPHAPAISAVATAGIAGGFPDGSYRPGHAVVRGQMATFLSRAFLGAGLADVDAGLSDAGAGLSDAGAGLSYAGAGLSGVDRALSPPG